jgi:hypothetical protein
MGINNPDILLPLLDDLIKKFQKWNYIASDIVSDSDRLQNIAYNLLSQEKQKVAILKNQLEDDTNSISSIKNEIDPLQNECDFELHETQKLISETQSILSESKSSLTYWENELSKAMAWSERANERLRVAEINNENTKIQVKSAQEELRQAKQALENCRNSETTDKDGNKVKPNCTYEESWVRDAEKQLRIAQQNLRNAELELTDSKNEVQKANECVNRCQKAVELTTKTVSFANKTDGLANDSSIYAKKSKEECQAAKYSQIQTENKLKEEKEKLNNSLALLDKVINNCDVSFQNNKRAIELTDSAQNFISKGIQDLEIRLDFLRSFASIITLNSLANKNINPTGVLDESCDEFLSSIAIKVKKSSEKKKNPKLSVNKDNFMTEKELLIPLSNYYPSLKTDGFNLANLLMRERETIIMLSKDPKKKEPDPYEGEIGFIAQGVFGKFKRDEKAKGDFVSVTGKYKNKIFDAFGIPKKEIKRYKKSLKVFHESINRHFGKIFNGNVDYLILDARAMNREQKSEVKNYIIKKWNDLQDYVFWIN